LYLLKLLNRYKRYLFYTTTARRISFQFTLVHINSYKKFAQDIHTHTHTSFFKTRSHLEILGAGRVTQSKLHTEGAKY
jgi:hypothetical protein